jgi:hypothetical protein
MARPLERYERLRGKPVYLPETEHLGTQALSKIVGSGAEHFRRFTFVTIHSVLCRVHHGPKRRGSYSDAYGGLSANVGLSRPRAGLARKCG